MRRRRSLDELLPLTLFSSLGTNGLNSSVQTERGRKGVREGEVRAYTYSFREKHARATVAARGPRPPAARCQADQVVSVQSARCDSGARAPPGSRVGLKGLPVGEPRGAQHATRSGLKTKNNNKKKMAGLPCARACRARLAGSALS